MRRSIIFLAAILFTAAALYSQEPAGENENVDFSRIDSSRKQIDVHIKLLREKNIDLKKLPDQLQKFDNLVDEIKKTEDPAQKKRLAGLAELNGENLLRETKARVAYTRRLELLYLMMVSFGALVILSILGYSVFMYLRRNKVDTSFSGETGE